MERILLSAEEAFPIHLGPLEVGRLTNLDGAFSRGKHLELPPVDLIRTNSGLLVLDGHHRLTQAMLHQVKISGLAYVEGEVWQSVSGDIPLTSEAVSLLEDQRRRAIFIGHVTFADLYRLSFPIDRYLKLIPGFDNQ